MTESNTPLGCGSEGTVSQYADLLNALEDMAGSYAYAVRKGELRQAGRTIIALERERDALVADMERDGVAAEAENGALHDALKEIERLKVCISETQKMRDHYKKWATDRAAEADAAMTYAEARLDLLRRLYADYLEVETASGFGIAPLLKRQVEAALAKTACHEIGTKNPDACPECGRKKARNVQDAADGLCPKHWAIRDPDALLDCEKHTNPCHAVCHADLIAALRSGQQADPDGVMVKVSRQACEEAAALLEGLRSQGILWRPMTEPMPLGAVVLVRLCWMKRTTYNVIPYARPDWQEQRVGDYDPNANWALIANPETAQCNPQEKQP